MYRASLVLLTALAGLGSGCGMELPSRAWTWIQTRQNFFTGSGLQQCFWVVTSCHKTRSWWQSGTCISCSRIITEHRCDCRPACVEGDELAKLNLDEYQLSRSKAKANFQLADVQYQQKGSNFVKDERVSVRIATSLRLTTNWKLERCFNSSHRESSLSTTLVAPYDGTISIIPAENHEYIAAKVASWIFRPIKF